MMVVWWCPSKQEEARTRRLRYLIDGFRGQGEACGGAQIRITEPVCDGFSLVGGAIGSHHRVEHSLTGDGTHALLQLTLQTPSPEPPLLRSRLGEGGGVV